jgi:hypothetical protein
MPLERPAGTALAAVILATGLTLGGFLVGNGFARAKSADRFVEVKGVSEKEAKADLALWPLRLAVAGNDLAAAQASLAKNTAQVFAFLRRHNVDTTRVETQNVEVKDTYATEYGGNRAGAPRYIVSHTLMVRSTNVDVVVAASGRVGELIAAGVVLTSGREYGGGGPTYIFTKLNDLKPTMIAEATASAREAAERFAADSRSSLGGIRQANQGYFVILPRDQAAGVMEESQPTKIVRVVATIQYFLKG